MLQFKEEYNYPSFDAMTFTATLSFVQGYLTFPRKIRVEHDLSILRYIHSVNSLLGLGNAIICNHYWDLYFNYHHGLGLTFKFGLKLDVKYCSTYDPCMRAWTPKRVRIRIIWPSLQLVYPHATKRKKNLT